ncbi:MAG: hypothetical protein KDC92_07250 [Bacteroidetes bacterium]|nr:hypothetical protein [Bacteroidota bacterium]
MRFWTNGLLALIIVLCASNSAFAQKKRKLNQKDLGKHGLDSRKHLNRSWLDLQNGTLPAFAVSFEAQAGMINIFTDEPNVELSLPFGLFAPGIQLNFNPSDMFGLHAGLQGRVTDVYYRSFDNFSNNGLSYSASGEWTHQIRSGALNFGISFYGNLTRKPTTCTGFRLAQRTEYTHFMLHAGMVVGRSIIDQLSFVGSYSIRQNGELLEEFNDFSGKMIPADGRRVNNQIFAYLKPGFRFAYGNYATRIGAFAEYQIGQNVGLVNDFSPHGFSSLIYGFQLGFEFF